MPNDLPEELKATIALCAGVPWKITKRAFDHATGIVTITYTTSVPCDVVIVDGRIIVCTNPNL